MLWTIVESTLSEDTRRESGIVFRLLRDLSVEVQKQQQILLVILSKSFGDSVFHLTRAKIITQELTRQAPTIDVHSIDSCSRTTSQIKDSTILKVRVTDTGPAVSYLRATVRKNWSPIPHRPTPTNRAHVQRPVGRTILLRISSIIEPEIMTVAEYHITTTATGVVFNFRKLIMLKAADIAAILASIVPNRRLSCTDSLSIPNINSGLAIMTTPTKVIVPVMP